MARSAGSKNYKNKKLIKIIEEVIPKCSPQWEEVAIKYQRASNERELRDAKFAITNGCRKGQDASTVGCRES